MPTGFDDRGFTMVVLLVVIALMAIGMTAMLPKWRTQAIREKEEELIFRGQQYARAIVLYSRKNNNILPASVDVLYEGKFLRKKWKDPITEKDFGLLPAGQPANAGRGGTPGLGTSPGGLPGGSPSSSFSGQQLVGSFQGVYSTSTDTSIRVYQNQQRYIDWQFTFQTAQALMGSAGRQGGGPGGGIPGDQSRGGRNAGPGGGVPGRGGGPGAGGPGRQGGAPQPDRGGRGPVPGPGRGGRGG